MRFVLSVLPAPVLLVALVAGGVGAQQLLYELVSPNEEAYGNFGYLAVGVGDVDGDGYPDIGVGAPFEDPGTSPDDAGRAYIFSGATGDVLFTLVSPYEAQFGYFGWVAGAGDVNNDGYADVIVGAWEEPGGATSAGRAYVFSGATGDTLYTLVSPNPEIEGKFGWWVRGAGDVDNDGYPDVIVGAEEEDPGTSPRDAGRAYVFSGPTGALIHTLVSPSDEYEGGFGWAVSGAGDVDGDGHADLLVGAPYEDPGTSPEWAGRAYVFSGATGDTLYTLTPPHEENEGYFGAGVWDLGDVDGDGYPDVGVGANGVAGPNPQAAGMAYIFSGPTGALLYSLSSPNPESGGGFGLPVTRAGDLNGDGYPDVAVGASDEDPNDVEGAGRAYIFSGATGDVLCTLVSPHPEVDGWFGLGVAGTGDLNNDGRPEVIAAARQEDPGTSPTNAGRVYVFTFPPTSAPDGAGVGSYELALDGPFPNPTDGSVRLAIRTLDGAPGHVDLSLYDVGGRRIAIVVDRTLRGGENLSLVWDTSAKLSPGIYWWRLKAGDQETQRAMVIAR